MVLQVLSALLASAAHSSLHSRNIFRFPMTKEKIKPPHILQKSDVVTPITLVTKNSGAEEVLYKGTHPIQMLVSTLCKLSLSEKNLSPWPKGTQRPLLLNFISQLLGSLLSLEKGKESKAQTAEKSKPSPFLGGRQVLPPGTLTLNCRIFTSAQVWAKRCAKKKKKNITC